MSEPQEGGATYCPSCGAAWTPGMAYCGACGWAAEAQPQVEASGAQLPPEQASATQVAEAARPDGDRHCAWCGTSNPADAERCVQCGAAFPRPEQDEALRKASEARIRAVNDSIAALRRQRGRRGLGRLFDR